MLLSSALLLTIATATLLIGGATFAIAWQQRSLRQQCESHLLHVSNHQAELVLFIENQRQLLEAQEILEDTIDITTATVRSIHKGIAAIPFGILEAIPVTRDTTRVVRGTHDLISDVVYGSISFANKTSGKVIRKGIGKVVSKGIYEDDQ
jgi:hypothetical protein